eukprot:1156662-Pelagomonas_calceolata.AAC.19
MSSTRWAAGAAGAPANASALEVALRRRCVGESKDVIGPAHWAAGAPSNANALEVRGGYVVEHKDANQAAHQAQHA